MVLVRYNSVSVYTIVFTQYMHVSNPNITTFQSNCAKGLHFSTFHYYIKSSVALLSKVLCVCICSIGREMRICMLEEEEEEEEVEEEKEEVEEEEQEVEEVDGEEVEEEVEEEEEEVEEEEVEEEEQEEVEEE